MKQPFICWYPLQNKQYVDITSDRVNLRYKSIDDPNISITVIPHTFIFFVHDALFPHNRSKAITQLGITYVDANPYLEDLHDWDLTTGVKQIPQFDVAMLFTT
ncbi:hypothetical protein CHS0354_013868 [Potamilus streckersoni]|uniref:Uncharacterized protein n=1 Tax=Potamilus streckersoni TaxID=2493646 RepID=A0AAE0T5Z0_9BIVA|nr:hypothetical protein CHS0354_013868 [Potamilus streckersoni]